jgi:SET domain-containing protein
MYKPLPESLTIQQSGINGLGLFAKKNLEKGTNYGMSHLKFNGTIFRTPLGGFINHSDTPNVEKALLLMTNENNPKQKFDYKKWNLVTLRDIKKGEELTVAYTFYNV